MLFKSQLLVCGGAPVTQCFSYNVANDTWNFFASSETLSFYNYASIAFNGKFYFFSPFQTVVYDPNTNNWTSLPGPPMLDEPFCIVVYKNTLLKFGGDTSCRCVHQMTTSNSWTQIPTSTSFDIYGSACGVLPNDKVLIIGDAGHGLANQNLVTIYNISSNTWEFLGSIPIVDYQSVIVSLRQRTFVMIFNLEVYEFFDTNNTFIKLPISTLNGKVSPVASLNVPSGMLISLPNGCKGI